MSGKTSTHVAGHAAAIYLGNKAKGLPPVFFQIRIHEDFRLGNAFGYTEHSHRFYYPKLEGGRLIDNLPLSLTDVQANMTADQKQAYRQAFEADVVNLLAGPIAEAKYVAISDDEAISPRLIDLQALQNYNGKTEIEIVHQYFECINEQDEEKEKLIINLYLAAFAFVNDRANWLAVTALANHISATEKTIIGYEEIVSLLESAYTQKMLVH